MTDQTNPPPQVNRWLVAISVMAGTFMVILDSTVVNVALEHIAGSLSATVEEATWALTSYLAANAVILPLTGWLARFFGRKRLLIGSVFGFTFASFLCGLAPSLPVLIIYRVIQGLTGGVMQPLSQSVLLEAFPPHERGKAMGFWSVGIVVAPILGPLLGGWLTDNWSWRWIFYINIPVGITACLMIWSFIFDPAYLRRGGEGIDFWGIGLLVIGIGSLQVGLDRGQELDWFGSDLITILLSTAAVFLTFFLVRELTVRNPVVDLRVFTERTFATGVFLATMVGFVLYGSIVLLPIMLQTLMGYSPFDAGIVMAPRGIGSLLAMPLVGITIGRIDARKLLGTGFFLGGFTLFWLSWLDTSGGYWDFFWPQFLQGISLGLIFVPLTTITMDRIPNKDMGNATSLFNLMRNIGSSVGIALLQTFLVRQRQTHSTVLGEHLNLFDSGTQLRLQRLEAAFISAGNDAATATHKATLVVWGMLQKQAAMLSFIDAFSVLGLAFFLCAPLVFIMRRPKGKPGAPAAGE
jgi:MFS transporter, DHA2 family, multidrug resistance protein